MVHPERELYVLNIRVRDSLTDVRAVEYMKSWNFTLKEYDAFADSIRPYYNPVAEKIIRFFINYDKLDMCPDKYDPYEPVRLKFDKQNIVGPISEIAFPAGTLNLKKLRKFNVYIENLNHGLIFDPYNKYQVFPSKRKIGEYLGDIKIFFKISDKRYTLDQMKCIVDDLCEYMNTDYGTIYHLETEEVYYKYEKNDDTSISK